MSPSLRHITEDMENMNGPHTPIIVGDWKVNVHPNEGSGFSNAGYRRYHRHDGYWYSVKIMSDSFDTPEHRWICGKCDEPAPDEMEGYINLMRWSGT